MKTSAVKLAKMREYYQRTRERQIERAREYRKRNRRQYLQRATEHRQKRKVAIADSQNREHIKAKAMQRYHQNPKAVIARNRRYRRERAETDPSFKMRERVRTLFRACLKRQGIKKVHPTFITLGYTPAQLSAHLESQFEPWMTWENYGVNGWHIDHKKPQCLFSFTSVDDPAFKECWALENLRPLGSTLNIQLGAIAKRQKGQKAAQ